MDEHEIMMSDSELREFWSNYELWLDVVEPTLPLPEEEV